jgi:hypothetical protein
LDLLRQISHPLPAPLVERPRRLEDSSYISAYISEIHIATRKGGCQDRKHLVRGLALISLPIPFIIILIEKTAYIFWISDHPHV